MNRLARFNFILRRNLSDALKKDIESSVRSNPVVVYMKGNKEQPMCGFSRAVVQILELQKVETYKTFDILQDQELRGGIKEFTSWPTIPQVFIDGEFVGGCDIMINMHQSGELEDLLIKKGIVKE
ncbi:monothiol glutaredoxin grx5 [Terramyces sp. JEL0728]|nr:monothiol glutaredoxin grx5 [Terramyces sp. JEL0728]KAJ3273660.1 monothiol glutaredoxin grx5 [Terramyces sp. JEL0728]